MQMNIGFSSSLVLWLLPLPMLCILPSARLGLLLLLWRLPTAAAANWPLLWWPRRRNFLLSGSLHCSLGGLESSVVLFRGMQIQNFPEPTLQRCRRI